MSGSRGRLEGDGAGDGHRQHSPEQHLEVPRVALSLLIMRSL